MSALRRLLAAAALLLLAAPAAASLANGVAAMADRAADRPVDVESFRDLTWSDGMDLRRWNSFGGSQNYYPIGAAARGDFEWVAALCRLERQEGLFGTELGSPGFYYGAVLDAKMLALRDAERAGRWDLADDIALDLRATWAYDALVAIETPRTSAWADLGGDGIVTGPGNADIYLGLTVAVAGNRWNGEGHGERWLGGDAHSSMLTWALDWAPRRAGAGPLRSPKRGQGVVTAFLGDVDFYEDAIAPEVFGLMTDERELLQRVVRGDVAAARTAAGWVADFGVLRHWTFTLTRTSQGAQVIFWGPWPNGNKPAHAATSITTAGEWRTIRPSPWGRGAGETGWDYEVHIEEQEIVARVRGVPAVHMPRLAGAPLWEVTIAGSSVTVKSPAKSPPVGWPPLGGWQAPP